MLKRILRKLKRILTPQVTRFDSTGERVDIFYNTKIDFETLDLFQKSHYKRYEHSLKLIEQNDICGDFACGTGYGSAMLAKKTQQVIGADINSAVVKAIQKRYRSTKNIKFVNANLLDLSYNQYFNNIISFETIEHFAEENILNLLAVFNKCLKPGGKLIISTPYMQEKDEAAIKLGHHLTFNIDEKVIDNWLAASGFSGMNFWYQNYETHTIQSSLAKKDFIICEAQKNKKLDA